jgi:hypothetical protein
MLLGAVAAENNLPSGIAQRVEGVKEFFLRALFAGDK